MKKTIIWLILILIMPAILTSCSFFPKSRETIQVPDIYTGTEGVEMYLLENKPPKNAYENKIIDIGLILWNKGAYDASRGMYSVAVNEQYIEVLDPKTGQFDIAGKSAYNPEGARQDIEIRAKTRKVSKQLAKYSTTMSFSVCYDYQTKASAIVCIDTKPDEKDSTKTCIPQPVSLSSQGAPVAVSNVEPRMTPHELTDKIMPVFVISIKNVGAGQAVKQGRAYDICMGEPIGRENYDVIKVNAKLADDVLACNPQEIKLGSANDKTICMLEKGISKNRGTYTSPLTINLDYGYTKTRPFTITIEKPTV